MRDADAATPIDAWPRPRRHGLAFGLLAVGVTASVLEFVVLLDSYPVILTMLQRLTRLALIAALCVATGARGFRLMFAAPLGVVFLLVAFFTLDHTSILSPLRTDRFLDLAVRDLHELADLDADGFGTVLAGGDCAPFDPDVNPHAAEVPGNGIDDNCRLGDLPAPFTRPRPAREHATNVGIVLITIDTLRADHVGAYGYERPTTPHIDRFFAGGTRFADAMASGGYTTITLPSLMRGIYPRFLNWTVLRQTDFFRILPPDHGELREGEQWLNAHLVSQDVEHPSLAMLFRERGFRTWAVVDDGGSAFLAPSVDAAGFDDFDYVPRSHRILWDPVGDQRVAERGLARLNSAGSAPFFLWMHFYGVHAPDAGHRDVQSFGTDVRARYDHEILHLDHVLGPVLDRLAELEKERPLITLLTSDHGERFGRDERAHGTLLIEEEIHVPLFLRGQGIAPGRVVPNTVSSVDVAPTLLACAGSRDLSAFDGLDLRDEASLRRRPAVFSDLWRFDARGRLELERVAAIDARHRLLYLPRGDRAMLYPRHSDQALMESDEGLATPLYRYLERTAPRPSNILPGL